MTMDLALLPTDTRFTESPDEGMPDCLCSRCGKVIAAETIAIRAWPADCRYELRYHPQCLGIEVYGDGGSDDWADFPEDQ